MISSSRLENRSDDLLPKRAPLPSFSREPEDRIAGTAAKAIDLLILTFSFLLAIGSNHALEEGLQRGLPVVKFKVSMQDLACALLVCAMWSLCLWSTGIYYGSRGRTKGALLRQVFVGTTLCSWVAALVLHYRFPHSWFHRSVLVFWIASGSLLLTSRILRSLYLKRLQPRLRQPRQAIIVGSGPRARQLALEIATHAMFDYDLLGFVDSEPQTHGDAPPLPIIGTLDDLETILMRQQVDDVFVALPMRSQYQQIERVLSLCEQTGVQSQYLADLFATSVTKKRVAEGEDANRIVMQMVHHDGRRHVKRAVDIVGALIGLVVLSPLFLIVAILIKLTSPGPIFFSQIRYGLNKRTFFMHKFRSMVPDAEKLQAGLEDKNESGGPVFKMKDDPRVTPIGKFIRKTSIDELPQLVNVLRGQMSLVGPRPLPNRDVSLFSEASLMRRFSVKPGMTGLWQVSGRSNTSFSGWISLDLHYIDHWSLEMDTRILLRTISVVMKGTGAS